MKYSGFIIIALFLSVIMVGCMDKKSQNSDQNTEERADAEPDTTIMAYVEREQPCTLCSL